MPSPAPAGDRGAAADLPARVPTLSKLGYGVGNVAYSLPYQATATFFIFYATAVLKIPPGIAGIAIAASSIWDAVIDPLIGFLSDNTRSRRYGPRHPYLLAGGLLIAALTALVWSVSPHAFRYWTVFLWLILLKTALATYYIPYLALGGDLASDYGERSVIQGIRAAFYLAGMILAIAGATFLFFRSTPAYPRGQLNPAAYPRMGVAFSAVVIVAMLIGILATRRYIPSISRRTARMASTSAGWLENLFQGLRNRDLLMLVLMIFVLEAGFQFGIAIGIHVNTYTYGLSGPMIGVLTMIVLGTSVLSQPFWVWFTKRYEKKTALVAGILIGFVGFIGAPWTHVWWKLFPIQASTLPWTLGIFMVAAGLGNGAFMSVPNSMISDAADLEELRTGRRDEGLYFGLYTPAYKFGVMISLLLSGFALAFIGFNPNLRVQSEATKFQLAMVPTYLLLATAPFALFFILRYGITRERWTQIHAELERRRAAASAGDAG
jgi:GPH family glycoside/pentoside/hexuronide:cation symporter